ncbi:3-methyl-2-oxobutanoate hydroxymethyltransferase [Hahella sp. CCB-MM4]|uniref:3-methyl-2-oxobutanoate hydroxymethyltransferase n=1 Tax=Hahella sp. (strain CCB-MM4) TaxID=1926491 RepID=UPI000B9AD2B6|nr:3-methyl-2-oxobutanoate hydroxymethyltransferase [Hahella sp. CCB-MM4]OZG70055.1 3-methyl-2-oxobutanoate hydroxymethyltransferase [Hahella sp. CCB-MM4]
MAVTLSTLQKLKHASEKFAVLTAYDATFANAVSGAGVEAILVGDSLGMVLQGHDSTIPVSVADMAYHTAAVKRGNQGSLIIADMPFMSYGTPEQAMENARTLMQAGAHMVKLEGGAWLCETTTALARQGIPVCVHMGLTPQSVNKFGGFKVQGKEESAQQQIIEDAQALVHAGADVLLLECVPTRLATELTKAVPVPVIGIGAGPDTDGQVLVLHDMLGLGLHRRPRFVKNFMEEAGSIQEALENYVKAVKNGSFPAEENCFNL